MRFGHRRQEQEPLDRWLDAQPRDVLDRVDAAVRPLAGAPADVVRTALLGLGVALPPAELESLVSRVAALRPDAFTRAPMIHVRMREVGRRERG
jgi:hypothetical protein